MAKEQFFQALKEKNEKKARELLRTATPETIQAINAERKEYFLHLVSSEPFLAVCSAIENSWWAVAKILYHAFSKEQRSEVIDSKLLRNDVLWRAVRKGDLTFVRSFFGLFSEQDQQHIVQRKKYSFLRSVASNGQLEIFKYCYDKLSSSEKKRKVFLTQEDKHNTILDDVIYEEWQYTEKLLLAEMVILNKKLPSTKQLDCVEMLTRAKRSLLGDDDQVKAEQAGIFAKVVVSADKIIRAARKTIEYHPQISFMQRYNTSAQMRADMASNINTLMQKELPREIATQIVLETMGCENKKERELLALRVGGDGRIANRGALNAPSQVVNLFQKAKEVKGCEAKKARQISYAEKIRTNSNASYLQNCFLGH
ncbi:MAG: hypothetical protein K0R63_177 [Rickettsiales bacterium]|jgi:hypothetical protein|nr:hypothetical protein [Rickettsiales bacterium]